MRRICAFLIAATLGGAVVGSLFPVSSAAAVYVTLYSHGGAGNYLECGWHGVCINPPSPGNALDWSSHSGSPENVFWRSYGERSDYTDYIAVATIRTQHSGCHRVRVDVSDAFGFSKGSILYTHTNTSKAGQAFYIYGGPNPAWTSSLIASTVWDGSNCSWSGYHNHQLSTGYPWYDNWSRYPSAPANGWSNPTLWLWHQSLQGWCWSC